LRVNFNMVTKIEAVDPVMVKFTLERPYADIPVAVAAYQAATVSAKSIDSVTTHPIGTGPFKFVEYRQRTDNARSAGLAFAVAFLNHDRAQASRIAQ
jgi:ABC-type transport system substrate-binding protein